MFAWKFKILINFDKYRVRVMSLILSQIFMLKNVIYS